MRRYDIWHVPHSYLEHCTFSQKTAVYMSGLFYKIKLLLHNGKIKLSNIKFYHVCVILCNLSSYSTSIFGFVIMQTFVFPNV